MKEGERNLAFRKEMFRGNRLMAGTFLAFGLAIGGIGVATTIGEIEDLNTKIASHEQTMSQEEMQKLNEGILVDEIMIALTPLFFAGIAGMSLYTGKVYNDSANLFKPTKESK